MHWFETQMTNIIVWIPPTPPYIFYPLSPPKNWEEWATDHPLKKLKMHTQLGWATKVLAGDVPGTSNILEILIPRVYTIRFYSILCHIPWCSKMHTQLGWELLELLCEEGAWQYDSVAVCRYFNQHSSHFCALWQPQFVVAEGHNIWEITVTSLRPSAAIVSCGQRPQQLKGHR